MDAETTIIVAAAAAHAGKSLIGEVVKDAWKALKGFISRKAPDAAQAVEALEAKPDSEGRRLTVKEEIAGLRDDAEFRGLLAALETALRKDKATSQTLDARIQIATGDFGIAGDVGTVIHGGVQGNVTINP